MFGDSSVSVSVAVASLSTVESSVCCLDLQTLDIARSTVDARNRLSVSAMGIGSVGGRGCVADGDSYNCVRIDRSDDSVELRP